MNVAKLCSVVLGGLLAALPSAAFAQPAKAPLIKPRPGGADFIRMLGPHASATLAPASGQVGALVELPRGTTAQALGLDEVAPGIGRLRASPERVTAFADAHPELHLEVAPPLRILVDRAAQIVGASNWQLYRRIVIPLLRPAFLSAFVILSHLAIKSYDLVIALTGGGPGRATEMPATFMYSYTFTRNQMGIGASSAVIMLMTIAAIMVPYLYAELKEKKA